MSWKKSRSHVGALLVVRQGEDKLLFLGDSKSSAALRMLYRKVTNIFLVFTHLNRNLYTGKSRLP